MTEKARGAGQETAPQDALREEILGDARRQAERLLRRARQEAKTLTEKADAEIDAWRNAHLENARAKAARRVELTRTRIPLERGRMRANRIEVLLQQLHEDARKRCADREGLDVRGIVIALAAEAVRGMAGLQFAIEVPVCDREALGANWLDEVRCQAERPDLKLEARYAEDRRDFGPVVHDAAERQVWDNRLVARLDRLWPALRCELADRMALRELPASTETTS